MEYELFEAKFRKVTEEILGDLQAKNLSYDSSILDLGINSLVFIQLIVHYEQAFEIEFEGEALDFQNYPTLADLKYKVENLRFGKDVMNDTVS